jgi:hypothetical protein
LFSLQLVPRFLDTTKSIQMKISPVVSMDAVNKGAMSMAEMNAMVAIFMFI